MKVKCPGLRRDCVFWASVGLSRDGLRQEAGARANRFINEHTKAYGFEGFRPERKKRSLMESHLLPLFSFPPIFGARRYRHCLSNCLVRGAELVKRDSNQVDSLPANRA